MGVCGQVRGEQNVQFRTDLTFYNAGLGQEARRGFQSTTEDKEAGSSNCRNTEEENEQFTPSKQPFGVQVRSPGEAPFRGWWWMLMACVW